MLLLSLDEPEDQAIEQVWAEEAERRYREVKSGAVEAIPSDQRPAPLMAERSVSHRGTSPSNSPSSPNGG